MQRLPWEELLWGEGLFPAGHRPPIFALGHYGRFGAVTDLRSLLGKQRIVLLFVSSPADLYGGQDWLVAARRASKDFEVRDVTLLIISAYGDVVQNTGRFPVHFAYLDDVGGAVTARYGGVPAFYLIGKDGIIKWAQRRCPSVKELFRIVDTAERRKPARG